MTDASAFRTPDAYLDLPRIAGLALSVDGASLVTTMSELNAARTKYVSSLWSIATDGTSAPRRLTRSTTGDSAPTFAANGDLLFVRAASGDDDAPSAVWALSAQGGEARRVAHRVGGVGGVVAASDVPVFAVAGEVLGDVDRDEALRALRKDKAVSAILHSGYPMRHWDSDLGPASTHVFVGNLGDTEDTDVALRTVTPRPGGSAGGGAYRDTSVAVAPDGSWLVATRRVAGADATTRHVLVRIDTSDGADAVLVDDPVADVGAPAVSPDGTRVAFLRETHPEPDAAPRTTLHVLDLTTGLPEQWAAGWDRWPSSPVWSADGRSILVTADDDGRAPIFVVTPDAARRLTQDDHAYTDLRPAPDGDVVHALRSSYLVPPHPVRITLADGAVTELRSPAATPTLPGTLEDVETTAEDGVRVRAWLALPTGTSADWPAPLVLWAHGGPLGSWNAWSWRWNPWMLVAQGFAVLLPDPALSTGYGQEFVQRGWGRWGTEPYTDLMAVTDAVEQREDIDSTRTAMMGGSFGGYMANWVAGHTDRFRAIVSHAGLWALDQFGPTTDEASYWAHEMTPEMAFENSPHLAVADIVTPMLVIHGDKDYRVPVGEALRLWWELLSESGSPADENGETVHRFLYFPDENHWILSPQHTAVWYGAVHAFLAEHVLGQSTPMPEILAARPGRTVDPDAH
ncbi:MULTISPECIES: alpha/beta fold hydrolase [Nocardiaceae]|uniref:Dipeptidyl aminopeptidase/acylaminoacyl peptidase n=1 Tax=Rhodococcoides corynebacterioides TaxID=53972 RepID=A0ABS2KTT4_9NOCA|nr:MULTISPECIES: alpha/beta fold hydrolase [Rhodococcus]MBM7415349.1 dipeptidyl aminopeptidase/acylaminoacyl peptidase [Rhodococcus corynebacterioides]MBP1117811.1 dipeptidyl aminopeptidase/acylaminoacyl peptidase [Rhodococcus sp. PvP016]